jgi:hypothetical protein
MDLRSLLPPSTNAAYRGSPLSVWFLMLSAVLTIVPGLIHYALPDGGAGVIAGIDLTFTGPTVIAIFAWYGALQIPFGLLLVVIALRYRTLVPLLLLLLVLQQALGAWTAWFWKGAHSDHHPPEHYASVAFIILGLLFLGLSLSSGDRPTP